MSGLFALQRYILKFFFPVFVVAMLFFILLLQLAELFINLAHYLSYDVPLSSIFQVLYLYVPKCIVFSFPMATLFAVAYTIGSLYSTNELTAMFSAGVSLRRLAWPLLMFGVFFSAAIFFFEDKIVIHSFAKKTQLSNELLRLTPDLSTQDLVVQGDNGKMVYIADAYIHDTQELINLLIIVRSEKSAMEYVIAADSARWIIKSWIVRNPIVYDFSNGNKAQVHHDISQFFFMEPPSTFQKKIQHVDQMSVADTRQFIKDLRRAGLPYNEYLAQYYRRFTFPLTIFIVVLLSIPAGGWFRKNTLLMTLLFSLSTATLYYVTEMMTMLFAKWEYISPLAGALSPFLIFSALGIFLISRSKT